MWKTRLIDIEEFDMSGDDKSENTQVKAPSTVVEIDATKVIVGEASKNHAVDYDKLFDFPSRDSLYDPERTR